MWSARRWPECLVRLGRRREGRPLGHLLRERLREARPVALQRSELAPAQDEEIALRRSNDGRVPPLPAQDRGLAEEVAGTERVDDVAVPLDLDRPALDHEERVAGRAFRGDLSPCPD